MSTKNLFQLSPAASASSYEGKVRSPRVLSLPYDRWRVFAPLPFSHRGRLPCFVSPLCLLAFLLCSPSVDWFPSHASFGAPSLSFFALLRDLFSSSVSFFSALFGRRQSLVSRSSKKCFCAPSLACARHAPARPVFRIIAFTSSPNAHNLLIWSVLR